MNSNQESAPANFDASRSSKTIQTLTDKKKQIKDNLQEELAEISSEEEQENSPLSPKKAAGQQTFSENENSQSDQISNRKEIDIFKDIV